MYLGGNRHWVPLEGIMLFEAIFFSRLLHSILFWCGFERDNSKKEAVLVVTENLGISLICRELNSTFKQILWKKLCIILLYWAATKSLSELILLIIGYAYVLLYFSYAKTICFFYSSWPTSLEWLQCDICITDLKCYSLPAVLFAS